MFAEPRTSILLFVLGAALACGPSIPRETLRANLQTAMEAQHDSAEASAASSRHVQEAVDGLALSGMRRHEVETLLGRGEPCSRHARCAEAGYESDDWYYEVGTATGGYAGPSPALIVGFSREGVVNSVWNLRTHE